MGCDIYTAADRLQPAGAIYFSMDEEDVQRILSHPNAMIGSDGLPFDAHPHPRFWGTFPRVLGHYARDLGPVLPGRSGAPHDQLVGDAIRPGRPRHRRRGSFRRSGGVRSGQGDRHRDFRKTDPGGRRDRPRVCQRPRSLARRPRHRRPPGPRVAPRPGGGLRRCRRRRYSARGATSLSSQAAKLASSQSRCGAPITWIPSGMPSRAILGKVMAGAPSAEVAALKAGSPVR